MRSDVEMFKDQIDRVVKLVEELSKDNEKLEKEIVRLKEYEHMYKDLCK